MGISFEQVSFTVNQKAILNKISGHFPDQKITSLIGPSGSGKTTLLKLCNGLISPDSGEIFVNGKEIRDIPPVALRRKVGYALQHAPMITGTVFDNLALPLRLQEKELKQADAEAFLENVGLAKNILQQEAKDLSGGQKQRVAIARTLINKTDILLLDEITASLDPEAATEIEQMIVNLNDTLGVTIIWITHDIPQAKRVGEYMWMLSEGMVVQTGDIDLLHHPTNEQVKQFIEGDTK